MFPIKSKASRYAVVVLALAGWGLRADDTALLQPPPGAPGAARGEVRLDDDTLRVRGEELARRASITIWIADADGSLAEAYSTTTESNGSFDLRDETALASSLGGRAVEVRSADGSVVLQGNFPASSVQARLERGQGVSRLAPPPGAALADAAGFVKVKASNDRHLIRVKVRGLKGSTYYEVYRLCIVNAAGESQAMGDITVKGGGSGAIKVDTADGGALPFGAAGIAELVGLTLQVKNGAGEVVLAGKVPGLGGTDDHPEEIEQEVEFDLSRPRSSPDDDIEGDINIEEEIGSDDKFRARIDAASASANYAVLAHRPHPSTAIPLAAHLDGGQEVPPVATSAVGIGHFSFNATVGELGYRIELSGLEAPEVAAHIHHAPAGVDGEVIFPLASGTLKEGVLTLTPAQAADLLAGLFYVNIHSEAHGGGEIRGQILAVAPAQEEIGILTTDEEGKGELLKRGEGVFPLGAKSLSELGGVVVEIIDSSAQLVLRGVIPQVGPLPQPPCALVERFKMVLTLEAPEPAVDGDAHGKIEIEEEDDEREMEIEIEDLAADAAYRVEIRDSAGNAEALFDGVADEFGDIRQILTTICGERLPLGVDSFKAYNGFSVVVLDALGATVLSGVVEVPAGGGAALPSLVVFTVVGDYDAPFLRGDANRDFTLNLTDAINTLEVLFLGRKAPSCADAMDINDDGSVDIADPVGTLIHLFIGSFEPTYPGSRLAGFDPTADRLACEDN